MWKVKVECGTMDMEEGRFEVSVVRKKVGV